MITRPQAILILSLLILLNLIANSSYAQQQIPEPAAPATENHDQAKSALVVGKPGMATKKYKAQYLNFKRDCFARDFFKLLSKDAEGEFDGHINSLVISDWPENITALTKVVDSLDIPKTKPQMRLEVKIAAINGALLGDFVKNVLSLNVLKAKAPGGSSTIKFQCSPCSAMERSTFSTSSCRGSDVSYKLYNSDELFKLVNAYQEAGEISILESAILTEYDRQTTVFSTPVINSDKHQEIKLNLTPTHVTRDILEIRVNMGTITCNYENEPIYEPIYLQLPVGGTCMIRAGSVMELSDRPFTDCSDREYLFFFTLQLHEFIQKF